MSNYGHNRTWTDERDEQLRKMIGDGKSARDAAAHFGVSRNAAIGRALRIGLRFKGGKATNKAARPANAKPVARRAPAMQARVVSLPRVEPVQFMGYAPDPMMLKLEQLTAETCKWPHGDPREAGFGFCGAATDAPAPYCLFHSRLAYTPAAERRRAA